MSFSVITSLDIEPLRHSVSKRVAPTRAFSFHLWKCPCERHWTPPSSTPLWGGGGGGCYRRKSNAWVVEKRCIQRHSAWKCELMWRWLWLKALGVVNKNWILAHKYSPRVQSQQEVLHGRMENTFTLENLRLLTFSLSNSLKIYIVYIFFVWKQMKSTKLDIENVHVLTNFSELYVTLIF